MLEDVGPREKLWTYAETQGSPGLLGRWVVGDGQHKIVEGADACQVNNWLALGELAKPLAASLIPLRVIFSIIGLISVM